MLPKIIIVLVLIIAAILTFGLLTKDKFGPKSVPLGLDRFFPSRDYFADTANLPSCGDKKELFTYSPLKLTDFTYITPLGLLSPTSHTLPSPHLYFNIRKIDPSNNTSLPVEVDIIAPANLKITTVKYIEAKNKPEFNDGFIAFGVCKEFKAYFDHIKSFSPKIKEAFDKKPSKWCDEYSLSYPEPIGKVDYKLCQVQVDIDIKAEEKIGTAGGGSGQMAFDLGASDLRTTPKTFANPKRWEDRNQLKYVVCPLDYFPADLQQKLKARLGGSGQKGEIRDADCGEVIQDVPSTAMGTWVPPETDMIIHEPPYLALVHDYIEPQYLVFSMGESGVKAGLPIGKYTFLPKNEGFINRHFKDITSDGKVYCFETEDLYESWKGVIPTTIILDMPTSQNLRIGKLESKSCGQGPWVMENFVEFVR